MKIYSPTSSISSNRLIYPQAISPELPYQQQLGSQIEQTSYSILSNNSANSVSTNNLSYQSSSGLSSEENNPNILNMFMNALIPVANCLFIVSTVLWMFSLFRKQPSPEHGGTMEVVHKLNKALGSKPETVVSDFKTLDSDKVSILSTLFNHNQELINFVIDASSSEKNIFYDTSSETILRIKPNEKENLSIIPFDRLKPSIKDFYLPLQDHHSNLQVKIQLKDVVDYLQKELEASKIKDIEHIKRIISYRDGSYSVNKEIATDTASSFINTILDCYKVIVKEASNYIKNQTDDFHVNTEAKKITQYLDNLSSSTNSRIMEEYLISNPTGLPQIPGLDTDSNWSENYKETLEFLYQQAIVKGFRDGLKPLLDERKDQDIKEPNYNSNVRVENKLILRNSSDLKIIEKDLKEVRTIAQRYNSLEKGRDILTKIDHLINPAKERDIEFYNDQLKIVFGYLSTKDEKTKNEIHALFEAMKNKIDNS
ncbi:MAG: hypothetical protein QNJ31_00915 [Candidatus Caenarcaniphilales bacterium]|nr:hypothetical protein [Candidatus Caenarcaniphilales bacterium]